MRVFLGRVMTTGFVSIGLRFGARRRTVYSAIKCSRWIHNSKLSQFNAWRNLTRDNKRSLRFDIIRSSLHIHAGKDSVSESFTVEGMKCGGCSRRLEKIVLEEPGILEASADPVLHTLRIKIESDTNMRQILESITSASKNAGFVIHQKEEQKEDSAFEVNKSQRWTLVGLAAAAVSLQVAHCALYSIVGGRFVVEAACAVLTLLIPSIRNLLLRGLKQLFLKRTPDMDSLLSLGVIGAGAASLSSWFTATSHCVSNSAGTPSLMLPMILIGVVLLGRSMERAAKARAMDAVTNLARMQPATTRVVRDESFLEMLSNSKESMSTQSELVARAAKIAVSESTSAIEKQDFVVFRTGDRVSVDIQVLAGRAELDYSVINGESAARECVVDEEVPSGVLIVDGFLIGKVTEAGSTSHLARVASLIRVASESKPKIQQLTEEVAGKFTWLVLGISLATMVAWTGGISALSAYAATTLKIAPWSAGLLHAASVLVASCPCALALATPLALHISNGIAASRGIYIRKLSDFEALSSSKTVLFDKSGVLTSHQPKVNQVFARNPSEYPTQRVIQTAALLESLSPKHPVATAILNHSILESDHQNQALSEVTLQTSGGVSAYSTDKQDTAKKTRMAIGRPSWVLSQVEKRNVVEDERWIEECIEHNSDLQEMNVVAVADEGKIVGLIGLSGNEIVHDGVSVVSSLQNSGRKVGIISGDRKSVVESVGRKVGIANEMIWSEVTAENKLKVLESLRKSKAHDGNPIVFVGDGVNDSAVLAASDVGIAVGTGADIAIDVASIVLQGSKDRISGVWQVIQIADIAMRTVRQNLWWALGYNTFALPLASGIFLPSLGIALPPWLAAILMASSSTLVVGNCIRLNRKLKSKLVSSKA
uniref:HMA domain-containing protein n=1 Tax=Timspurckia oligopyrenoides TaxID=708627 RepID=A0A7S1ESW8_9RHOD|mmetsp:Transcript_6123/g.10884  ORF Transcript_6123/g.10884 Transcript_6123/m.10884 type:complete len:883 (+) Transcript_6123:223-2871(+)